MFVLLGRDPQGADLVRLWAKRRELFKPGDPKIKEALQCADQMEAWCRKIGRTPVTSGDAIAEAVAQEREILQKELCDECREKLSHM